MSSTKPCKSNDRQPLIALVDCNNFYVSCERIFNPKLLNKPVAVLSNNDGCIIARSNELKALGIPMGAPLFEYRQQLDKMGAIIFSANFALYGDISNRIMQVLETATPDLQIYSIDEAFLSVNIDTPLQWGLELRQRVLQWVGVPISVGIAPTKTLAKVASHLAKKNASFQGVKVLDNSSEWNDHLKRLPVGDVWGIGRGKTAFLSKHGIFSAYDFCHSDENWIRKNMTVVGLKTAQELKGISCIPFEEIPENKKSITCSRSYGIPINSLDLICEATASYVSRAAEKLRDQNSLATRLTVFLMRHPYKPGVPLTSYMDFILPQPTAYTPTLIQYATEGIRQMYIPGQNYRKSGVYLSHLVQENAYQPDLFHKPPCDMVQQKRAMDIFDAINRKYGSHTMSFAAEGISKDWKMKQNLISKQYTTNWNELLKISI